MKSFIFLFKFAASIFVGNLFGFFCFWAAIGLLGINIEASMRDLFLICIGLVSSAASIGGLIGYALGPKVFEGAYGGG